MAEHARIVRVARYRPRPGSADELWDALHALAAATRGLPGLFGAQNTPGDRTRPLSSRTSSLSRCCRAPNAPMSVSSRACKRAPLNHVGACCTDPAVCRRAGRRFGARITLVRAPSPIERANSRGVRNPQWLRRSATAHRCATNRSPAHLERMAERLRSPVLNLDLTNPKVHRQRLSSTTTQRARRTWWH